MCFSIDDISKHNFYITERISFLGRRFWRYISEKNKNIDSLENFKKSIRMSRCQNCSCRACKVYLINLGFCFSWYYFFLTELCLVNLYNFFPLQSSFPYHDVVEVILRLLENLRHILSGWRLTQSYGHLFMVECFQSTFKVVRNGLQVNICWYFSVIVSFFILQNQVIPFVLFNSLFCEIFFCLVVNRYRKEETS